MYVCVCMHVYVLLKHTYIHTCIHTYITVERLYLALQGSWNVGCKHAVLYTHTHTYIYTYTYITVKRLYLALQGSRTVCCNHIIHTHIHTYIYTHIHTQQLSGFTSRSRVLGLSVVSKVIKTVSVQIDLVKKSNRRCVYMRL
jgi:hypothetical protein